MNQGFCLRKPVSKKIFQWLFLISKIIWSYNISSILRNRKPNFQDIILTCTKTYKNFQNVQKFSNLHQCVLNDLVYCSTTEINQSQNENYVISLVDLGTLQHLRRSSLQSQFEVFNSSRKELHIRCHRAPLLV